MRARVRLLATAVMAIVLFSGCSSGTGYSLKPPDNLNIWGLGDSMATGLGPQSPGWVDAVETKIGEPVVTLGLGGATYADIYQWLLQQTQVYGYPLRMIVMAGSNDLDSGVPVSYMEQNAAAISSLLVAQNVDVTFITIPPASPLSSWGVRNNDRVAFNAWLVGSSMAGVDCSTPLQDGTWIKEEYVYAGDHSHLSPAGVEVLSQCIADAL
jgi:lysophospholipase L1-like esterase